jgi:bacillithiol biosynthesis cysteine-adding enzyme BshC
VKVSGCSFSKLPFNTLFTDYINDFEQLQDFFQHPPLDITHLKDWASDYSGLGHVDRSTLVELLSDYNSQFDLPDGWNENVQRLEDPQSLAIVTGQQSHLYGGPLYSIYKILSAIDLAKRLEQHLERPVVPVFWMGDEDHDYEEVSEVVIPKRDELQRFRLDKEENGDHRVSELRFGSDLTALREEIRETLIETDFSDKLWELLDQAFQPENDFRYAVGHVMGTLFSKHGLILAGSNHDGIKQALREPLSNAIRNYADLRTALETQSEKLAEQYHQQVTIYDSNLFYIDDDGRRLKIAHEDDSWIAGDRQWDSVDGLVSTIEEQPERFSPNVFIRPILQDHLLPTVAYVGGPGEISYYAQMRKLYEAFDMEMPVIWPRMSGTLIDSAIERVIPKLPFEIEEYQQRIEDLESAFVEQAETMDIEAVFGSWKDKAGEVSEPFVDQVSEVDPTLRGAAEKAVQSLSNELDRLKGKVYRATKQQEKTQINRIHKVKNELFPEQNLQERTISFVYYMNKHGLDLWDDLLETMQDVDYDQHQWIYLD